jgi:hypothetical protein
MEMSSLIIHKLTEEQLPLDITFGAADVVLFSASFRLHISVHWFVQIIDCGITNW